jgi:hypothetical protein
MTKNIINIIISVMLMLALSHCDNRQQTKQTEEDIAGKKESERVSTVVKTKSLRNIRESKYRLTTEEIIAYELKVVMDEYEQMYKEAIPNCEQCSDLELLLILEKIGNANYIDNASGLIITKNRPRGNIKSVSYLKKEEMTKIKDKLKDIEAKYEEKFKSEIPWWWMCSVEERIRRLEEAIKTGKRYEDYYGAGDRQYYQFAKAAASYELRFNKPIPRCMVAPYDYQHLEKALKWDLPLLSFEEDAELKKKLKMEYQIKFGRAIPDTLLIMTRVFLDNHPAGEIAVTRTVTGGAVAKNLTDKSAQLELELSIREWLDFINALYKLIHEQQERELEWVRKNGRRGIAGIKDYGIESILYIDLLTINREYVTDITNILNNRHHCIGDMAGFRVNPYDLDKNDFDKLINDMAERIKKYGKTSYD